MRARRRDREFPGEDADPARTGAAGRGRRDVHDRAGVVDRAGSHVSPLIATACVALGLGVVVVRRRSVALTLVTAQSLLLVGVALWRTSGHLELMPAAGGLLLRPIAIATILGIAIPPTPETQPLPPAIHPLPL